MVYYLHVEPLGKMIVSWYPFGTMFGNLGKLVAEIQSIIKVVFLRIFSYFL